VVVEVADRDDPLVAFLGETIPITDEIYQIRDFDMGGSRVLLRLDPTSVDLTRPNVHRHPYGWPLARTRSYGAGRVFYTALGHEEGVWRDPRFQLLLRNAALWALRKTELHVDLQGHLATKLAPKQLELMRSDASGHLALPINPTNPVLMETTTKGRANLCPGWPRPMTARLADVGSPDAWIGVPYITFVSFRQYNLEECHGNDWLHRRW
jgi:hypothetical protein